MTLERLRDILIMALRERNTLPIRIVPAPADRVIYFEGDWPRRGTLRPVTRIARLRLQPEYMLWADLGYVFSNEPRVLYYEDPGLFAQLDERIRGAVEYARREDDEIVEILGSPKR